MKTLSDYVNDLTQIERDYVIQWLMEQRPAVLRQALRECGYIQRSK
jgi:hypothetical protein